MWASCEDGQAVRPESEETFHTDCAGSLFSPCSIITSSGSDASRWRSSLCSRQERAFV